MRLARPAWALAQRGLDAFLDVAAALAWGLAAFALGSRFVSPLAGELMGLAVVASAGVMVLSMHLRDNRLAALAAGICPRCRSPLPGEHRHRRWEPQRSQWLVPDTTWECGNCTFEHQESWECPTCPKA